jgi:uncharacterized membrane protein
MTLSTCLAVAAVVWSVALAAAAIGATAAVDWLRYPSALVYGLAALICHQRPERSFATGGVPWPVCARCTGLYAGALLGSLAALRLEPPQAWDRFVQSTRRWLPVAAAPTLLTLVVEWVSGVMPGHVVRSASAVPLGAALALVLILAAAWPPAHSRYTSEP